MNAILRAAVLLACAISAASCGSPQYRESKAGTFAGDLDVRWIRNDQFLFIPARDKPFTFTRADGTKIVPAAMYTDGGSIPRMFWGVSGFSPWGYAPAFIVHDWIFEAKHCANPAVKFTFEESAEILGEGLKAIMEKDPAVRSDFAFTAIVAGVRTPIARKVWDDGKCKPVGAAVEFAVTPPGELITTLKF